MDHIHTGRLGEDIAVTYLKRKGFVIVDKNYARACGEIDIIAKRKGVIRFVEVKTISRKTFGQTSGMEYRPEEQAHDDKLRKVAKTAELYMLEKTQDEEYQIDVVAITLDDSTKTATCRLFEAVL